MNQNFVSQPNSHLPISAFLSDSWVEIADGTALDLSKLDLSISFPCGLAAIDRSGALLPASVEVEVQAQHVAADGVENGEWFTAFKKVWSLNSLDRHEDDIEAGNGRAVRLRARLLKKSEGFVRTDAYLKAQRQAAA
ncbi:hypothetical protein JTL84_07730 [Pseudomonas aeruginosa]|nr:hypothetical protein [Pseudomonas aeruginosa]